MRHEAGPDARRDAWSIYAYFVPLTALLYVIDPVGPFFDIAITYVLKDHLHASLGEAAGFRLLTAIPVYAAVVFGFARDRWHPFGERDRGYFLLFAPLLALLMGGLAMRPLTYGGLLVGVVGAMVVTRFLVAAYQGLMARVAHTFAMSGRLATVWQFTTFSASLLSAALSGVVAHRFSPQAIFAVIALAAVVAAAYALIKPAVVYGQGNAAGEVPGSTVIGDLRRLLGYRAIYPALAVMLMFQFSPGQGVVLQYYLVDRLHATDAVYGYWYAAFLAGFLPMFLVYGYLCQRVPFGRLLTVSAWVAVPQAIPLAFLHSPMAAVALAVPVGMLGGLMWAAVHDLAMRSCPPGLYGTLMMFVSGMNALGTRGGDLIGTHLYTWGGEHGFRWCVAVTTLMYLGIVFVIRRVPKQLTVTADGEAWRVA
jgi:hypothetical protein